MPITFPRPHTGADRYDAYRVSSDSTDVENILYPRADGMEIENDDPDLVLCLRSRAVDPAFDPDTERLGPVTPTYDTDNGTVTRVRPVVALTQQELDDRVAAQAATDAEILLELSVEPDDPISVGRHDSVRIRSIIEQFNRRDNYIINRIAELQAGLLALQSANGNANSRLDALPDSYMNTNTRTKADAITVYKDDLPNQV